MTTPIPCPACEKPLPIPDTALGKGLTCPGCGTKARVVGEAGALALESADAPAPVKARPAARPAPSAARRSGSGRVTHRTRGGIDHDAEPAGSPVPTVLGVVALCGLSVVLLAWALWYLQSNRDQFLEWMAADTGRMVTKDGVGYSSSTVAMLALAIVAYVGAIVGLLQGRAWAAGLATGVAVLGLVMANVSFRGMPWTWPLRFQLYTWSQLVVVILAWLPVTRAWIRAKANDRALAAAAERRSHRAA
jgi:hypothetical protein